MRVFMDNEFMEDGTVIEPLSFGMVREDGAEFYAEVAEANLEHANIWVKRFVIPHLHTKEVDIGAGYIVRKPDPEHPAVMPRSAIAEAIVKFVGPGPEFWAYYDEYDWVVLCQLYGTMMDLPPGWPMMCRDVKELALYIGDPPLPAQESTEHIAINDARWTKVAYDFLKARGA